MAPLSVKTLERTRRIVAWLPEETRDRRPTLLHPHHAANNRSVTRERPDPGTRTPPFAILDVRAAPCLIHLLQRLDERFGTTFDIAQLALLGAARAGDDDRRIALD